MQRKSLLGIGLLYILYLIVLETHKDWNVFLKPILVPLLIFAVLPLSFDGKIKLIFALIFSTLGDIFLLFKGELFFILGLGSFLIAHVWYIVIFANRLRGKGNLKSLVILILPVLVYLGVFLSLLWNQEKMIPMRIPVVVYACVISTMLLLASSLFLANDKSKIQLLFGALFFVISDSCLAWNLFHSEIPHASLIVMSTYLLAQLLLTWGISSKHQS